MHFLILLQPKVVTDLDEKEIKKRLELLELEGVETGEGEDEENEEGLTAPADLDKQVDLEEADGAGDKEGKDEESDDEEEQLDEKVGKLTLT